MEDRSNIIKEAIEYRDKLEKKVKELAQSVVRLQVSLDFADDTIKKKDREIAELEAYKDVNEDFKTAWAELKAENDILKEFLNQYQEEANALKSYETYKVWLNNKYRKENERLKEENYQLQKDCQICENFIDFIPCKPIRDMDYDLQKVISQRDNYYQTLQEIKKIAEHEIKELTDSAINGGRYLEILDLITKAESEG